MARRVPSSPPTPAATSSTCTTSSFLKIQGLEITGGSDAVKFQTNTTSHNVVLEDLYCHNMSSTGVNAAGVTELYNLTVRGCDISYTGGNGEGMYLGVDSAYTKPQVHDSLVERNFVHNVIGDGIELKHGDHHITVQDNVVNAVGGWPGITVWGTYKNDPTYNNIVRRNFVYACTDCDIQALSEANVENNICVNSLGSGIYTRARSDGKLQYLRIVNNTIYKAATDALAIHDGNLAQNLVVANNAIFQSSAAASALLAYQGLSAGTVVAGNVTYGIVSGVSGGWTAATSPAAVFTNASTTIGQMDLYPRPGSILIDGGNTSLAATPDFNLVVRPQGSAADVGACEVNSATNPGWQLAVGLKVVGVPCDLDHDGLVDVIDLLIFVDSFGKSAGDPAFNPDCDFDNTGSVDVIDLLILVDHWPS